MTKDLVFCPECRKKTEHEIKIVKTEYTIKDKKYMFDITTAYCKNCGEEIEIPPL